MGCGIFKKLRLANNPVTVIARYLFMTKRKSLQCTVMNKSPLPSGQSSHACHML
jgi:hypothetical protein